MVFQEIDITTLLDWLRSFPKEANIKMKNVHKEWSAYILTEWEDCLSLAACDSLPIDELGELLVKEMTIDAFIDESEEYLACGNIDVDECLVMITYSNRIAVGDGTHKINLSYDESSNTVFIQEG